MNKFLLIFISLLTIGTFAMAQTFVAPGEATLYSALEEAEDGDVLQLVPGGLYTESTNFEFGTILNKSITIESEESGGDKPIIQMLTPQTLDDTPNFFLISDNASLTLRGLEFDGNLNENPNSDYLINIYMGEFPQPTTINTIRIEDCYIHNLISDVLAAGNGDLAGNVVIDSTFMHNVVIENTATPVYYKYTGAHYISLKNSTFHNISSYGIRISGSTENQLTEFHHPTVIVDHTTWYNIGTTDPREILLSEKEPNFFRNPWTVTNSIFVKQVSPTKTMINIKDTQGDSMATITNIAFWEIGNIEFREHTVQDTIRMDPDFADPDNGDFTLPVGSPLLSYGTKGDAIGDPRWAENSTSIGHQSDGIAKTFALEQNYPNPFNPNTTISFTLDTPGMTTLKVYDILGKEVAVLTNSSMPAGTYNVPFDARALNSGIYFYKLQTTGKSLTRKMMLLK